MARAAVLAGPRVVEVTDTPVREPRADEVVVAIEGCGVCGSNLPVWQGRPWFQYPLAPGAPGHEGWGRVDQIGDDVAHLRVGQRVAVLAENAFAEAITVRDSDAIPLPRELDGVDIFPGEALACAFNAAARSAFVPEQTVAVVGIGFMGALITALAAQAGARVIAISRRPFSLEIAKAMGAHHTIAMTGDHQRVVDDVADVTSGQLCDRVVEAVGTQEPLDLATALTRVRGTLVIAGYHQDGTRSVDMQLWNWRGIDVVNAHERDPEVVRAGVRSAAAALAAEQIDPSPLYTHTFPLDQMGSAMDAMAERPDGFLKAVVRP